MRKKLTVLLGALAVGCLAVAALVVEPNVLPKTTRLATSLAVTDDVPVEHAEPPPPPSPPPPPLPSPPQAKKISPKVASPSPSPSPSPRRRHFPTSVRGMCDPPDPDYPSNYTGTGYSVGGSRFPLSSKGTWRVTEIGSPVVIDSGEWETNDSMDRWTRQGAVQLVRDYEYGTGNPQEDDYLLEALDASGNVMASDTWDC